jgi:GNAT superfamily N-acetyltransferase
VTAAGPGNEIAVRGFRRSDLGRLSELVRQTIETSYADVYPPRAIAFFKDYHGDDEILEDAREGRTVVVSHDGELVATGTLRETNVRRVFVRADLQGRGIGRLVMDELEREALARGVARVDLSASLPAKEFYLGRGYEIVSEEEYILGGGQSLRYYEMAKTLAV